MRLKTFIVAMVAVCALACRAAEQGMLSWEELPALPDALGVAGPFAGVSHDALLVAGGANFPQPVWESEKAWRDTVYVMERAEGGTGWVWSVAGKLERPLAYGMSVSAGDAVICMGGDDGTSVTDGVFALTWDAGTHTLRTEPLPSLPQPCAFGQAARLGDTVYVAGGQSGRGIESAMRNFWRLDLSKKGTDAFRWEPLLPWPGPERVLAVVAAQNAGSDTCVFVISGRRKLGDAFDFMRDGYAFNPRKYQAALYDEKSGAYAADETSGSPWRPIPDAPACVMAGTAAPMGQSHLFVLGGADGSLFTRSDELRDAHPGFPKKTYTYHTITETWADAGPSPLNQVTTVAVPWGDRVVIPSGEIRPRVRTPRVTAVSLRPHTARFGLVNYLTLTLYLGGMVWLGGSFARKNKTTDDFFRGGQRIPWWAAGVSIFATMLSSITFMAIPAQAYSVGWNLFLANTYILITPLVVWVFLPFYRALNVTSAYEYLERRFNTSARLIASALFILFQCGRVAIVLFLPALALSTVSDMDVTTAILLMGVLCVIYTVLGGMEAVIWTDFIQTLILMGGAVWALVSIVMQVDGGAVAMVREAAAHGKFFQTVPWTWNIAIASGWIVMIGSIFTNLFPYTASQDVVQRYVTTPDRKTAARAIWTNAAISVPAQAIFFAIGTALFIFYRHHPERLAPSVQTDGIFPLFIVNELPVGVAGLIVAGIFAAAQSTLAGSLNSVATAWVTDFHCRLRPHASDAARLRVARWVTVLVGTAGTATAIVLAKTDVRSLWETFITVVGLFGGTVSGLFLLGVFSRRAHGRGALVGAVASTVLVGSVYAFKLTVFWLYPVVGVISCVALGWLASLLLPGPHTAPDGLTVYTLRR